MGMQPMTFRSGEGRKSIITAEKGASNPKRMETSKGLQIPRNIFFNSEKGKRIWGREGEVISDTGRRSSVENGRGLYS